MLEREVSASIAKRLAIYQLSGEVLWALRINSGSVPPEFRVHIKLAPKGTPDYLCLIKNKNNGISAIFIEVKRSDGKGKLSPEQKDFKDKYMVIHKDIYCMTVNNPHDLDNIITEIAYDKLKDINWTP